MHLTLPEIQSMIKAHTGQYIARDKLPSPVQQATAGICHGVSQWYWSTEEITRFIDTLEVKL
ncbi:MAG TPA: hypothetical protein VIF37_20535 [Methylobacter sp.]